MIQLAGIVKMFIKSLSFHMDAFLRDAVIDPGVGDDNRGIGRRNAGILNNLKTVYYRGTETKMKMNPVSEVFQVLLFRKKGPVRYWA